MCERYFDWLYARNQGPGLRPRHVSRLGIEPATFRFTDSAQSTEPPQPGLKYIVLAFPKKRGGKALFWEHWAHTPRDNVEPAHGHPLQTGQACPCCHGPTLLTRPQFASVPLPLGVMSAALRP